MLNAEVPSVRHSVIGDLDHGEYDERSAKKRFIMASPANVGEVSAVHPDPSIPEQHVTAEAGEDIDYVAMPKASCQRASVLLYLRKAGLTSSSSIATASRGPWKIYRVSAPAYEATSLPKEVAARH